MVYDDMQMDFDDEQPDESEYIDNVEPTNEWTTWRENLAQEMWNTWNTSREA